MEWTLKKILDWSMDYFQKKEIDAPRLNAELLLGRVLGLPRVSLYVQFDRPMHETELAAFKALVQRRASREPLAYILGEKEFYSLSFEVGSATLIPRPETEGLVELGLEHLQRLGILEPKILDIATGTGCILIALLHHLPQAHGVGFDLNPDAVSLARRNAERYQINARCTWWEADFHQAWPEWGQGPFDLITANLPYVAAAEWEGLQPEIRDHEPKLALVSGLSGLEAFERVLPQIPSKLSPEGMACLEIGMEQGPALLKMAEKFCTGISARIHPDLSGRPRILELGRHLPKSEG